MATTVKAKDAAALPFADLKVGDRVWAASGVNWRRDKEQIKTVVKTTPAFIVLDGFDTFNTFKRSGKIYGKWLVGEISRRATASECADWDAEEARKKEVANQAAKAKAEHEAKKAQLRELFASANRTNNVYVSDCHNTAGRDANKFDLTFHDLTEEEIRTLAETLAYRTPDEAR